MAKTNSGFLDGALTMINALSLLDRQNKPRRPSIRRTITRRQVYDAKRGKIITLTTETISGTKEY